MYYHLQIHDKGGSHECKINLTDHELAQRVIQPYQNGDPIVVNGRAIKLNQIGRIRIFETEDNLDAVVKRFEREFDDDPSPYKIFGNSPIWDAIETAREVTDRYITGPPGHKNNQGEQRATGNNKDMLNNILKGNLTRQLNMGQSLQSKVKNAHTLVLMKELYDEYKNWRNSNMELLSKSFTAQFQTYANTYRQISGIDNIDQEPQTFELIRNKILKGLEKEIAHLNFLLSKLKIFKNENLLPFGMTEAKEPQSNESRMNSMKKIFISHSSKDKDAVGALIDLLEAIGLKPSQIFCSSFEGYGIPLGADFLARLKSELDSEVLVLFLLSKNFYDSPISLCEMGATWIKTNKHIPILIPPFQFTDIKGVFPLTQGMLIDDKDKLNSLKEVIEADFMLTPIKLNIWEKKRETFLKNVN